MTDDVAPGDTLDDADALEAHPLTRERLAKYRSHIEDGGFPYSFSRTHTAGELHVRFDDLEPGTEPDEVFTVAGRLMNTRVMGKLVFAVLSDVTGTIQLFVDKRTLGDDGFAAFLDLDAGDWIGATGAVLTTKRGEVSVRITSLELLQKSLRPMPDKWHGLKDVEARSRQRYLDLMANAESRVTAVTRSKVIS
ncbi:MAG: OB-fold nucleic acid binding domain-containing protein, partial [Actinomycetia bacterium]|nr:OB-fold nucleic acid binding domain-containing protein [Actinomycetes bacterium]